jgi:hypothetical protein
MSTWTRADLVGYLKAGAPSADTHIRDNYIEKWDATPSRKKVRPCGKPSSMSASDASTSCLIGLCDVTTCSD